jgi:hypothetical protein
VYLEVGDSAYTKQEAQDVIAGYAFGTVVVQPKSNRPAASVLQSPRHRRRWAYSTYDCYPPDPGGLTTGDVTVTSAVNSRIGGKAVLGVMAVASEVSEALDLLPVSLTFWDLPRDDVVALPRPDSVAFQMWCAWDLLMGVVGVDVAICHKILHHKRPQLFPLLDGITTGAYPEGEAWAQIHGELSAQAGQFGKLETWFSALAAANGGVPLLRLRLHDILLWCHRAHERAEAGTLGAPFVEG